MNLNNRMLKFDCFPIQKLSFFIQNSKTNFDKLVEIF